MEWNDPEAVVRSVAERSTGVGGAWNGMGLKGGFLLWALCNYNNEKGVLLVYSFCSLCGDISKTDEGFG